MRRPKAPRPFVHKPPSESQLAYLRALATKTGRTFIWPTTSAAATHEIRRLQRRT